MPGKSIDRFVFSVISATVFYLFFLNAWGNIPLACFLAFICSLILRRLILKRPVYFKCTRAHAEAELLRIAQMTDSEAGKALEQLVRKRYPDESFTLSPMTKHPSQTLSMADVFAQWKKHRVEEHLLIACTCSADPRAIMYARELNSPLVAVIDKRHLLRIIRTTGIEHENAPRITFIQRLKRIPQRLSAGHASMKNALFGVLLIALYFLVGNVLYLFLGLGSLFLFGCTLPGKRYKKRLFQ